MFELSVLISLTIGVVHIRLNGHLTIVGTRKSTLPKYVNITPLHVEASMGIVASQMASRCMLMPKNKLSL